MARTLLADRIPHIGAVTIDWSVMAFNAGLAVATGVACGLLSLPVARRVNLTAIFNEAGSFSATPRQFMRRVLLSAETAVTFVLVVGAALLGQTLWNLRTQDNGFDADRLLTVRVNPGLPRDLDRSKVRAGSEFFANFFGDLRGRLERIDGVTSAGAVSLGPLEGSGAGVMGIVVNGQATPGGESRTEVDFVTPGYFQTMHISLLAGRDFQDSDRLGGEMVAIVNEAFQRKFSPSGNILGARITTGSGPEAFTVIGVAEDVPDRSLRMEPDPLLIAPLAQMPGVHISWGALTFVLRTDSIDPMRLAPDVRRAIWAIDPNIVISDVATMDARVAAGMRAERDSALLFGTFAAAALIMAAIGVYGVAAYSIAQRTKEIGIRVSLGAVRRDVSRLVVSHTLWPVAVGIAIGIAGAAAAVQLISSMVYGVEPLDAGTFAAAIAVLVSMALAGTWVPARRAMHIDPLTALRE
jgi:predicted permease